MRLVHYENHGERGIGVKSGDGVVATGYVDLRSFIDDGCTALEAAGAVSHGDAFVPENVLAPLPNPGKMLFCGLTHRALRSTTIGGERVRDHPYVYVKLPLTIIGHGEPIVVPTPATEACWETELLVIVGKTARNVSEVEALEHVFGYTIVNDVTAMDELRDYLDTWTAQMTLLKNYPTFCPMGPEVVLTDELTDPNTLAQRTIVNGEIRQDGSMADCWYGVEEIIAWLSSRFPLYPGDVISTGTPPGIAAMAPGDEVVCEIEGVGRLVNPVVAGWEA